MPAQLAVVLRSLGLSAGATLTVAALAADRLGGQPGFGRGQVLMACAGAAVIAAALLGRRLPAAYRGVAVSLLSTLVCVALVEVIAMGVLALRGGEGQPTNARDRYRRGIEAQPYYRAQPWSAAFFAEHWAAEREKRYHPYVVWRAAPAQGRYVNIDADGLRATPGSTCDADALQVHVYGGSAVWGWGAPDDGTLPAHLARALKSAGLPACVRNFGQNGFVSSQDVLELIGRLRAGDVPDVAIFYNGANDITAAAETGRVGTHLQMASVAGRLERAEVRTASPVRQVVEGTHTYRLLRLLAPARPVALQARGVAPATDLDELGRAVADEYLSNYDVVARLAASHGFVFRFFWQPLLPFGAKTLTAEEQRMAGQLGSIGGIAEGAFRRIAARAGSLPGLQDMRSAFDAVATGVWIDFVHVTPEGNALLADRIIATLDLPGSEP